MRWVILLVGCLYNPSVADGVLACAGTQCPEGYYCAGNQHCYKNGHTADLSGSVDAGDSDFASIDLCHNGVLDDGEADVDCGGVCATACANNSHCLAASDCASKICNLKTNKCVQSDCEDGTRDDAETDIDCGGGTCGGCATGQVCQVGSDCANKLCNTGKMMCVASTCDDGAQDGTETDVDCGGSCTAKCKVGQGCMAAGDCVSPSTCDGTHHCTAVQCTNGMQDSDNPSAVPPIAAESDIDCGGLVCAPCPLGKKCVSGSDCQTGFCNAMTKLCVADACHDGAKDGSETDIDCGGSCATKCADGQMCKGASDCASSGAICTAGSACCVPSGTACAGFDCGMRQDNCGQSFTCGSNGGSCQSAAFACTNNVCCQTQASSCSGKCGTVTNNCSTMYACNSCPGGYSCNASNCCAASAATACAGHGCQTVGDGCGGQIACSTTGCGAGQVCNGTTCCTQTAKNTACSGNGCNTVSDGCGGSYDCLSNYCPGCPSGKVKDCNGTNCICTF
jgi:hypothetical protein